MAVNNAEFVRYTKRDHFKPYIPLIKKIVDQGRGISLSEIRDMINSDIVDANLSNKEIKMFISEHFSDSITFCKSERENKSLFVFSSNVGIEDILNSLRSLDSIKSAALDIRRALLDVDFGLNDKFCDADELKDSWKNPQVLEVLLSFFATLFNIKKTSLAKYDFDSGSDPLHDDEKEEDDNPVKIKSIFHIIYYQIHHGRKICPLYI